MTQLVIGYPGCGIVDFANAINDPTKVVWMDDLDIEAVKKVPSSVQYVCTWMSETSLQDVTKAKIKTWFCYPSENAYGYFLERQSEAGVSDELLDRMLTLQARVIRGLREDPNRDNRHIILSRGEHIVDYLPLNN